jgi:hypothetical protein
LGSKQKRSLVIEFPLGRTVALGGDGGLVS